MSCVRKHVAGVPARMVPGEIPRKRRFLFVSRVAAVARRSIASSADKEVAYLNAP